MSFRKLLAMAGVTAATATMLLGTAGTASATSWGCSIDYNYNEHNGAKIGALATCYGNGPMRVAAYCDTDRYPYRTTVYGNWASNVSGVQALSNCWISSTWVEV